MLWQDSGLNVDDCFQKACSVTGEWEYARARSQGEATTNVRARLRPRKTTGWQSQIKLRTLQEILTPQKQAADVYQALLRWIDTADMAAQHGELKPPFQRPDGSPIFPADEKWWLTEAQQRGTASVRPLPIDGDGPGSEDEGKAAKYGDTTDEEGSEGGNSEQRGDTGDEAEAYPVADLDDPMRRPHQNEFPLVGNTFDVHKQHTFSAQLMWMRKRDIDEERQ